MNVSVQHVNVTLKLYAGLTDYLPAQARTTNRVELVVGPRTTVSELIEQSHLPPKLTHLVLVNGVFVAREDRATHVLSEGDILAIWPPIAGG